MTSRNLFWAPATMLLLCLALLPFASPAFADMKSIDPSCSIVFNGEIDRSTADIIANKYEHIANKKMCRSGLGILLFLNSGGGNVDQAIRVGDFIRQNNIETYVDINDSCASACVLTFLGGVKRHPFGPIGLHRPYSLSYSTSERESRNSYERINHQIIQYLTRMNIPERLLDAMNAVSPREVEWIQSKYVGDEDYKKLVDFHLIGTDPVFDDQKDSADAKRLEISKKEYYSREQRAKAVCPDAVYDSDRNLWNERLNQQAECYWSVMYGSKEKYESAKKEAEARKKEKIARAQPSISDDIVPAQPYIDPNYDPRTSRTISATRNEFISALNKLVPNWQIIRVMPEYAQYLRRHDNAGKLYYDLAFVGDANLDPYRVAQFYLAFKREYGIR